MFRKTLTIKVLTPVHIGSGNNLHQIDLVLENGRFFRYDWDYLIDFLIEKGLMAEFKEVLKKRELKTLTDIKAFLETKGFELPEGAILYSAPISCSKKQIEEFIKLSGKVYLPGSELKGSLRRALLLYALEKDNKLFSSFKRVLEERLINPKPTHRKPLKKVLSEINTFLEDRVFRPFGGSSYGDLLKFISFSDSSFCEPEEVLEVKEVRLFKLPRVQESFELRRCSDLIEDRRSICSEVVRPGSEFTVSFLFRAEQFRKFREEGKRLFNNFGGYRSTKVLELFTFSGEETLKNLLKAWSKAEKLSVEVDKTLKSCLEESGLELTGEGHLIRLGKHEGFLFTTVMPALLRKGEEEFFAKVVNKLKLGKGRSSIFPKTRKFLVDNSGKIPLGFCSVEF
ncbi:type III-A CRISPR-associated RAMP protein Csm5 [Thermovibrio sp.]